MKKSGIFMFLGPTFMIIGMRFSTEIARLVFGSESLNSGPGYADYALSNRINAGFVYGGLLLFLVGIVYIFKEIKITTVNPRREKINIFLSVIGSLIFLYVAYKAFWLIWIGINWQ